MLRKFSGRLSRFSVRATPVAAEALWEAGLENITSCGTLGELCGREDPVELDALFFFSGEDLPNEVKKCIAADIPVALNMATALSVLESLRVARTATLIFNPVAGSGNAGRDLAKIRERLEPGIRLEIRETTEDVSGGDLAREALESGAEIVIAAGGDGTVAEVAEVLIGTRATLGIIPRGTANALISAILGGGLGLDPIDTACAAILSGTTRLIDTAHSDAGSMFLLAGVGIEAGMVERAERDLKSRFGVLAYLVGGWEQVRVQEEFEAELTCDGVTQKFRTRSLVVANAAPPGSVLAQGSGQPEFDDGYLDVTAIVDAETPWETLGTMIGLLNAGLTQSKAGERVLHLRAKKVRVAAQPAQKLVIDGEVLGETPVEFEVRPRSLRVCSPTSIPED